MRRILFTATSILILSIGPLPGNSAGEAAPKQPDSPAKTVHFTSTDQVLRTYGKPVRIKLRELFKAKNVAYPPSKLTWICLKQEKLLFVFASDKGGKMREVLRYPIIGTSGGPGPKLKEGDKQVPEGFYKLDGFRPNVIAHMALSVNYPNAEDKAHARQERRTNLGSDILIHGSKWSTGCLAMGNEPIEELYVLSYDTGLENIRLIFAPCNLASRDSGVDFRKQPPWLPKLYERLTGELKNHLGLQRF